jgi:transcriptional regulator NrdR family protein
MAKYKIPKPRECFYCGGKCYARNWFDSTTTGRPYAEGVAKVYWQCADCGRRFETMEHIDRILIEVEEMPDTCYPCTYIEIEEEIE